MTIATENMREIALATGTMRYRDVGAGAPLVFVHGILANSTLWREVIPALATQYRCIAPDLPLGGHVSPMSANADMTPAGVARLLGEFLDALHLDTVTLVGSDTGGAICQILLSQQPTRIARLVLTNCDAFEQFFPPLIQPFQSLAARFGDGFVNRLARLLQRRGAQRRFLAFVARRHFDDATLDAYFTPLLTDPAIRHDATRFLAAVSKRYTLAAAQTFGQFMSPVLLVWGTNDLFFSRTLAKRLQAAFPHATLKWVSGSRAFVSEDQPQILAQHIQEFLHGGDARPSTDPRSLGGSTSAPTATTSAESPKA